MAEVEVLEPELKDEDFLTAEKIVKPYLTSVAIYGVLPDHRFREMDMLPMQLVSDIAEALRSQRASIEARQMPSARMAHAERVIRQDEQIARMTGLLK